MKNIFNLVITGGPSAGKTTALGELADFFRGEGYTVYTCNDVVTELINDGVRPFGEDRVEVFDFQQLILKAQLSDENIKRIAAEKNKNDKVVIIHDGGILDIKANIDEDVFQEILRVEGLKEEEVLTRYDLVIHLVTTAVEKEEYFLKLNEGAGEEGLMHAREHDQRIMNAWRNHINRVVISNDTLFDGKIEKIKNEIRAFWGENKVTKLKRYLVKVEDCDFDKLKSLNLIEEEIEEFVKQFDDEEDEMYCKRTINGHDYYSRIKNIFMKNGDILRKSRNIGEEEYVNNKQLISSKPMLKIRYNTTDNGERYRVDFYCLGEREFIILEHDVVDESKQDMPSFIKNAIDITNDKNYNEDSIYIDFNIERIIGK